MKNIAYFKELTDLFSKIRATDNKQKEIVLEKALSKVVKLLVNLDKKSNKVIFIGNGGSASIASHIVTDLVKNATIPALTFNDSSLLTCLSNDLGYEYVFQKPIEILAKEKDILFSISSSGKSKNILNAAIEARKKGCLIITLSGFSQDNPLRQLGNINFYLPSESYGFIETVHSAICHCIVDKTIEEQDG